MDPLFNKVQSVFSITKSVKKTSEQLNISRTKVKKILITLGLYTSMEIDNINTLLSNGYSKKEVCDLLNISMSFLNECTPYSKCLYHQEKRTKQAFRSERFRIREALYQNRFKKMKEERKNGKNILPY